MIFGAAPGARQILAQRRFPAGEFQGQGGQFDRAAIAQGHVQQGVALQQMRVVDEIDGLVDWREGHAGTI